MSDVKPTDADRERAAAAAMDAEDRAAAIDALIEGGSELAFRWHWARGAAYRGHQHWTGGVSSEQFIGVDFAPYLAEAIEKVRASAYAQGRADEREACAKVCDARADMWRRLLDGYRNRPVPVPDEIETAVTQAQTYQSAAAAIRARAAQEGASDGPA